MEDHAMLILRLNKKRPSPDPRLARREAVADRHRVKPAVQVTRHRRQLLLGNRKFAVIIADPSIFISIFSLLN